MLFYNHFRSNIVGLTMIAGKFQPNGTSAIDNSLNRGAPGWTVAYSATGIYTLTLDRKYPALVYADAGLEAAALVDGEVQFCADDVVSAKTVEFRGRKTSDGTTAVAFAAAAGTWINFILLLNASTSAK